MTIRTHHWRVWVLGPLAETLTLLEVRETEWGYMARHGDGLYWVSWPIEGPGVINLRQPIPKAQRWSAA